MRTEVILVGDELLEDRWGVQPPYLQGLLEELRGDLEPRGHSLGRLTVAGDGRGELAHLLTDAATRGVDVLITVGGLGPTHDDRVREEAAIALGVGAPEEHPEAMAWLREAYRSGGVPLPDPGGGWERMGHCPPGARPLRNPAGMACGLAFELGEAGATRVRCLPGVTHEALPMWRQEVLPGLGPAGGAARGEATLLVRGAREGAVGPVVEAFLAGREDLRAGVYLVELVEGQFRAIRVTLRGAPEAVEAAVPELWNALVAIEGVHLERSRGGDRLGEARGDG